MVHCGEPVPSFRAGRAQREPSARPMECQGIRTEANKLLASMPAKRMCGKNLRRRNGGAEGAEPMTGVWHP